MRREATIGLAVISILVVVFGVVLYNRFVRTEESLAGSVDQGNAESQAEGKPAGTESEASSSPSKSSRLTVVMDKAESEDSAQQAPLPDLDPWPTSTDEGRRKAAGAGVTAVSSPPSLMPEPSAAHTAGRYAGLGSTPGAGTPGGTSQSGPLAASTPAEAQSRYDPFQAQRAQAGTGGDRTPALQPVESACPTLSNVRVHPLGNPDSRQGSDSSSSSSSSFSYDLPVQQHNSLRVETGTAAPGGDAGSAARYPDSSYAGATSEYVQSSAGRPRISTYRTAPRSTDRTTDGLSDSPGQARVSTETSGQSDAGQSYAWTRSSASDALSDANAAQQPLAKPGTYVVQPNDNYWAISEKLYGTGAYFRALARHNRGDVPDEDRLGVGDEILAPAVSELEKAYPDLCPKPGHRRAAERRASLVSTPSRAGAGRVYTVQQGDTVFDIARYELGKASRWVEIIQLNRSLLGDQIDYLTPGMKLVLPDDQPAGTVTRRSDASYQR